MPLNPTGADAVGAKVDVGTGISVVGMSVVGTGTSVETSIEVGIGSEVATGAVEEGLGSAGRLLEGVLSPPKGKHQSFL